tara:strand:+ start:1741 stop:2262 length:522 start_codon:yes stop_codon:yes gene_type:complete
MKNILKIPSLLFTLILIVSSCGSEENKNKESICALLADQKKLMNDILKHGEFDDKFYNYLDSDSLYYDIERGVILDSEVEEMMDNHYRETEKRIVVLRTEFERIEAESDKYMEVRDGRTQEDVKANQETLTNCPEFSEMEELLELEEFKRTVENMCYFNEIKDLGGPWCQMIN